MQPTSVMKYISRIFFLVLVFCLFQSACITISIPQQQTTSLAFGVSPQAWLDAPLNGAHLPHSPYEVVFHITDASQVNLGELSINGTATALLINPEPSKKIAAIRYNWNPPSPGEYLLEVRAQNAAGAWSEKDSAIVYIDSPQVQPVSAPAEESSAEAIQVPESLPASISDIRAAPGAVSYGLCKPTEITISARAFDPAGIQSVMVFYRLRESGGTASSWLNASMSHQGNGAYQRTLSMSAAVDALKFAGKGGTFEYQIILQNTRGEMLRSEVRRDVVVNACGGMLIVPLDTIKTPSPTPIIIK